MNELIALAIIAGYMAIGFLFVYPRARGVTTLRWLDAGFGLLTLATVGAVFFNSDPAFKLVFFETNWFVFALVAMVFIETPLWYLYMKAHPQQGTLAELYGLAPNSKSKKTAKNIETVMQDTKWDGIRTAKAQRLLVVFGAISLVVAPVVFWFEDYIKPGIGILFVVPIFIIWLLLRLSVRLDADAPDEYLDEFQVRQRDRTYLHSFRILAALVTALVTALMFLIISTDARTVGSVDYYQVELTFGQFNAIIWLVLGTVILTPNLVLAWNQAKAVRV